MTGPLGVEAASLPANALAAVVALVGGYLVGSIPLSARIGRAAGFDAVRGAEASQASSRDVWRLAGPGWGLLALSGDLAKGVLPVALATVTCSWGAGWAAGLGALLGAGWPLAGRVGPPGHGGRVVVRRPGGGIGVLAGVLFALSPSAGMLGALLALSVLVAARLVGRNGRVAATSVGIATYPLLFLAEQGDPLRLAGLMTLYLVVFLRLQAGRR